MKRYCLFDSNVLIKYYVPLQGSDIIIYLIDKNKNVQVNISNVQVVEMISLFHSFYKNGIFSTPDQVVAAIHTFLNDITIGKIKVYEFSSEHILDFSVYKKAASIPTPDVRLPFVKGKDGIIKGIKDEADGGDIILLLIAREMNLLSNENFFLVTSDSHVKAIASSLNLKVLDPETVTMDSLPVGLDIRKSKRAQIELKAFCAYEGEEKTLPLMRTLDISENGICLEISEPLDTNRRLAIKLTANDNYYKQQFVTGEVLWSHARRAGILTDEPINLEALLN